MARHLRREGASVPANPAGAGKGGKPATTTSKFGGKGGKPSRPAPATPKSERPRKPPTPLSPTVTSPKAKGPAEIAEPDEYEQEHPTPCEEPAEESSFMDNGDNSPFQDAEEEPDFFPEEDLDGEPWEGEEEEEVHDPDLTENPEEDG